MTRLFRAKSCSRVEYSTAPPTPILIQEEIQDQKHYDEDEEEEEEFEKDDEDEALYNSATTPFSDKARNCNANNDNSNHQFAIVDILVTALRKSIVTCSVERDDVSSSLDISWPTEVRHVSHVTFDRFNGFLGLPTELEPQLPRRVPSASVSVFGVSAQSMQCTYDDRGNSVPTILLMMQKRLYSARGLQAEGIFRINAENGQEERVRDRLNKGIVPHGIDVHCLAGLIKAWFRELPRGVLDSLSAEQVMRCNTEDDCSEAVKLLPATEASLLDWSVNLMADVVHHEHFNKMNARNIAMVFAPNMTQMSDPLTALIHAVQVMNFLKTLIVKTLREREESKAKPQRLFLSTLSKPAEPSLETGRTSLEPSIDEKLWCNSFNAKTKEEAQVQVVGGEEEEEGQENKARKARLADHFRRSTSEHEYGHGMRSDHETEESGDWLSLRRGVRRLCKHPVFQLNRPSKKTPTLGLVNTNSRETGGEAWA